MLCFGDVMLDSFNHGIAERISPERPVPVFRPGQVYDIPGGAANVARNVTANLVASAFLSGTTQILPLLALVALGLGALKL